MTSEDDIIPMSHNDIMRRVTSLFPFEGAVLPTGCDTKGMFRGNKSGEAHMGGEFLPDHGRVRISTCSLVTSVEFI